MGLFSPPLTSMLRYLVRRRGTGVGEEIMWMKRKCRCCRIWVLACGFPPFCSQSCFTLSLFSPPLLSLACCPPVPHEWSCFSSTPACLGEAWSLQTDKTQTKTLNAPCAGQDPQKLHTFLRSFLFKHTWNPDIGPKRSCPQTLLVVVPHHLSRGHSLQGFLKLLNSCHGLSHTDFKLQKQIFELHCRVSWEEWNERKTGGQMPSLSVHPLFSSRF